MLNCVKIYTHNLISGQGSNVQMTEVRKNVHKRKIMLPALHQDLLSLIY